jgi:ribosome biogenesis GTPase
LSDTTTSLNALGWDQGWAGAFADAQADAPADAGHGAPGARMTPGRVARADRGACTVLTPEPMRADANRQHPVVGDWVALALGPGANDPPVVHAVLPRRSAFTRHRTGRETTEQVLAANIDVVFVVGGLDVDPNPRRIERYLTLAWQSGAVPVVVLTKADCCAATEVEDQLALVRSVAIGVDVHAVSGVSGGGVAELAAAHLGVGTTAVLLGPSGVGKSTLVNRLAAAEVMPTGETRTDGKGRHTTTAGQLVALPEGGVLLDTPGLRGVALWDSDAGVAATFADVEELAGNCRFADCRHDGEPGCAVRFAIEEGALTESRLAAWRKLQRELRSLAARQGDRALRDERLRHWKAIAKANRSRDKRRDR